LCLGTTSRLSNAILRICFTCQGAWSHRRCWRSWYQQQRITALKKAVTDRLPLGTVREIDCFHRCPICRTGMIDPEVVPVGIIDDTIKTLERLQSEIYKVCLIAMEYTESLRSRENVDGDFQQLDEYLSEVIHDKRSVLYALLILFIGFAFYSGLLVIEKQSGIASITSPAVMVYSLYLLFIYAIGGWLRFVWAQSMTVVEQLFERVEERSINSLTSANMIVLDDQRIHIDFIWWDAFKGILLRKLLMFTGCSPSTKVQLQSKVEESIGIGSPVVNNTAKNKENDISSTSIKRRRRASPSIDNQTSSFVGDDERELFDNANYVCEGVVSVKEDTEKDDGRSSETKRVERVLRISDWRRESDDLPTVFSNNNKEDKKDGYGDDEVAISSSQQQQRPRQSAREAATLRLRNNHLLNSNDDSSN